MREREHPLSHRNVWEDVVDEMRGAFGHAPPAAARAEPAAPAGEGHEPLGFAIAAPEPREAASPEATPQKRTELVVDEPRQTVAVAPSCGVGAERFDVLANNGVEHRSSRVPRSVLRKGHVATGAAGMPQRSGGAGTGGTAVGRTGTQILRNRWTRKWRIRRLGASGRLRT